MSGKHFSDEEIVKIINNKSLDQIIEDNDHYDQHTETHIKARTPLYVIVAVAFLIASVNGIFFQSNVVLAMCLIFGGGTFVYLWLTRNKT